MATTVKTTLAFQATTIETLDPAETPGVSNRQITHEGFNVKRVLDGATTPALSLVSEQTLGAASGTIDLTAVPTTQGAESALGLRLKVIRVNNRGAHPLVLSAGASNGYALPGGVSITVPPGGVTLQLVGDALGTIDATHKTLDFTFHAGDQADLTLLFGPPPA